MRDTARGEPTPDGFGLGGAFRPQTVIDSETPGLAAALSRPTIGKDHQSQAVGAARYADGNQGPRLKSADGGKRGVKFRLS
jgi:hypothetical protein